MTDDPTITHHHWPGTIFDPRTEIALEGALRMLCAAPAAAETFTETFGDQDARGVVCLTGDTVAVLAYHDAPAEHRDHLRTPTPVDDIPETHLPG